MAEPLQFAEKDAVQMLARAQHPRSGECLVCGGIETFDTPHTRCVVGLIERYAARVLSPGADQGDTDG